MREDFYLRQRWYTNVQLGDRAFVSHEGVASLNFEVRQPSFAFICVHTHPTNHVTVPTIHVTHPTNHATVPTNHATVPTIHVTHPTKGR